MKNDLLKIIEKYLCIFPGENRKIVKLIEYINNSEEKSITDWNNFNGHIVASAFVYAKKEKKFLSLYHKDLKMYLYPGGHIDSNNDKNPLEAAKREVFEECGLYNLEQLILEKDKLIPIDIDIHKIEYNKRLKLPEHIHFDFRYLFFVDNIKDIQLDEEELEKYLWEDLKSFSKREKFGDIVRKLELFNY